jgi:predicted transposase YbfD/YdcC
LPKKTFETAAEAHAHLIVQLKDNQLTLCRKVEAFCRNAKALSVAQTTDPKLRNRHEVRTIGVYSPSKLLAKTEWAPFVKTIIEVERKVQSFQPATGLWKESFETSFYLSNRPIDATLAANAIRKHWAIENSSHYVRDVTLREDASRIRVNPGVFARLRSFAYNILRFNQKASLAQDRYALGLGGFDALASLRLCNQN